MAVRFRKSVKIAPGVRMNIGKKGISTSVGGRGLRVNTSSRGVSVGSSIPGTGISYNKRIAGSRNKRPQRTNYERIRQQQEKEIAKENQINQAAYETEKFEAHLAMLTSVHEEVSDPVNWKTVATSPRPFDREDGPHTQEINQKIKDFKPTWRDKLFNRTEARVKNFKEEIPQAREKDDELLLEWKKDVRIADLILNGDIPAMEEAIENIYPFEDIIALGSSIAYEILPPGDKVIVNLQVENKKSIPETALSLTKTGKLSEKNMPKGKYFQLYQDYVCSCVLRISREFFALLPIKVVQVNVYDESPADDTQEFGCILSVNITREQMEHTNLENIDCSDTVELFSPNMKFLKTKGFKYVQEVQ